MKPGACSPREARTRWVVCLVGTALLALVAFAGCEGCIRCMDTCIAQGYRGGELGIDGRCFCDTRFREPSAGGAVAR